MRIRISILAIAAVLAAGACGGSGGTGSTSPGQGVTPTPPTPPVQTNQVSVGDDFFTPPNIQVPIGTDGHLDLDRHGRHAQCHVHRRPLSGDKAANATYQRTFATAGTFSYSCTIHPVMVGSVLVQ